MPAIQETTLQSPDMMHNRFYVQLKGKDFQTWEQEFIRGETFEFFLEEEQKWVNGTVQSWNIDDGSGNAPGANAHFFVVFDDAGEQYRVVLYKGMRIRLELPTVEELKEITWCEGGDWTGGAWEPSQWVPCDKKGKKYVVSGQARWYCDEHKSGAMVY